MTILSFSNNLMAVNAANNLSRHYTDLSTSTRRLASGLRVGTAADDAAGLAIRELMRADIAAYNQGARNANDAISLIQTADGALQVIDEKLIRMKELAEQAATGTYDSTQRLMIDSEFQAMAAEIQRIAMATEFNNLKLLDGSRSGTHDGSGLDARGELKVHFGPGNDSAEDYYYLNIGDATLRGLGLTAPSPGGSLISDVVGPNGYLAAFGITYGLIIPKGTTNLRLELWNYFQNPFTGTLQLFTVSGKHIAGTTLGGDGWRTGSQTITPSTVDTVVITEEMGFDAGVSYDGTDLNGFGGDLPFTPGTAGNTFTYNGMTISYSGDGNPNSTSGANYREYLIIDVVTEDLNIITTNSDGGVSLLMAWWDDMPSSASRAGLGSAPSTFTIQTQAQAQLGLDLIDEAIIHKDKIRAHLGATQNRLENTATNLQIQAENLQAAESRISDADVAEEMTEFVKHQILAQAANAMLAQANNMPRSLLGLLG
jgi:flagellin